jgi:hypothetical protein
MYSLLLYMSLKRKGIQSRESVEGVGKGVPNEMDQSWRYVMSRGRLLALCFGTSKGYSELGQLSAFWPSKTGECLVFLFLYLNRLLNRMGRLKRIRC